MYRTYLKERQTKVPNYSSTFSEMMWKLGVPK